jgi:hypothetical protein
MVLMLTSGFETLALEEGKVTESDAGANKMRHDSASASASASEPSNLVEFLFPLALTDPYVDDADRRGS